MRDTVGSLSGAASSAKVSYPTFVAVSPSPPLTGFLRKEAADARTPEDLVEHVRRETSLVRVVEASGLVLPLRSRQWEGVCPLHEESRASLLVSLWRRSWNCFGCDRSGGRPSAGGFRRWSPRIGKRSRAGGGSSGRGERRTSDDCAVAGERDRRATRGERRKGRRVGDGAVRGRSRIRGKDSGATRKLRARAFRASRALSTRNTARTLGLQLPALN